VLVGVQNVGALRVQETGDAGHDAAPVGTMDQEDGGAGHGAARGHFVGLF